MIDLQRKLSVNEISDFFNEVKEYIKNSLNKLSDIENNLEKEESKFIVDRFEGGFAVCESINNKQMVNIKKEELPINIKEGMVLKYSNGKYITDFKENNELRNNVEKIVENLWEN